VNDSDYDSLKSDLPLTLEISERARCFCSPVISFASFFYAVSSASLCPANSDPEKICKEIQAARKNQNIQESQKIPEQG
jgi:hypothetical protein